MAYPKTTFRIYEGSEFSGIKACRVSTAVTLNDGSIYQVFPVKRSFATVDEWRSSYSTDYETRRELNSMEKRLCQYKLFEAVLEPLSVPEQAPAKTAVKVDNAHIARIREIIRGYGYELVSTHKMDSLREAFNALHASFSDMTV